MARSSATGETRAAGSDPPGVEHALQPVRTGGRDRPIAVAVAIGVVLTALVWQPWGRGGPPAVPPSPAAIAAGRAGPSASDATAPPGPSDDLTPGPGPSFRPIVAGPPASTPYLSLVDNEWTVVAFLTPEAMATADQPWVASGAGAVLEPVGALLVLQLGPNATVAPIDRPNHPDAACRAPYGFRDQVAAHYPAHRVAYLGVTYPGMDPLARVTGVILDRPGSALKRLPVVSVALSGMVDGRRYTVPTSGTGGAALFSLSPPAVMPVASYRFDIQIPGVAGHRYLYACVGP